MEVPRETSKIMSVEVRNLALELLPEEVTEEVLSAAREELSEETLREAPEASNVAADESPENASYLTLKMPEESLPKWARKKAPKTAL